MKSRWHQDQAAFYHVPPEDSLQAALSDLQSVYTEHADFRLSRDHSSGRPWIGVPYGISRYQPGENEVWSVRGSRSLILSVVTVLCAFVVSGCQPEPVVDRNREFNRLVDQHFEGDFAMRPVEATLRGFHDRDGLLDRYLETTVAAEITRLRNSLTALEGLDEDTLDASNQLDRIILINSIEDQLLDLDERPVWRLNPGFYNSIIDNAILALIERPFAPLSERLQLVIERERRIPAMLEAARENLNQPTRVLVESAIGEFQGTVAFFRDTVPQAFEETTATDLLAEFVEANDAVIRALEDFIRFLQTDALAASVEDFAVGYEFLERKLRYRGMVTEPIAEVEQRIRAYIVQMQEEFVRTAGQVIPSASPREVMAVVTADHPSAEELLSEVRGLLENLRTFCIVEDVITIPSQVRCEVVESPAFARTTGYASLDAPGLYESTPQEAYLMVTLPDPTWDRDREEQHLRFFNRAALPTINAFLAYPGIYIQHLWMKTAASKVRRLIPSGFFEEGWAHYSEQMVLDEGYRADEPRVRLAQLSNSILRATRPLVALGLHTGQMTEEEAVDLFVTEAYQERANAETEVRRWIRDPVRAFTYTLGKLQILDLREEYRQQMGDAFSMKRFHDDLLRHGAPPIPLLREILLSESAGS